MLNNAHAAFKRRSAIYVINTYVFILAVYQLSGRFNFIKRIRTILYRQWVTDAIVPYSCADILLSGGLFCSITLHSATALEKQS